jgi:hypothetical protein
MELTRQWCDNSTCSDFGKGGAGNIKVFSDVEPCVLSNIVVGRKPMRPSACW